MKLFWKLFITLGVAMTVAMVAAVTMGWQVGQLAIEQFVDFNFENREAVINRASQALNRGGREELTSWLRQNQIPVPGRRLYIIDDGGEDLLGREIPEDARRFLRYQSFGQSDRRWDNFGAGRNRMGPQFTEVLLAPSGDGFRIVFDRTAITLLNILRMPATQVGVVTLAIVMAAGTALLLAQSFSSPIVRLQRATRALAAGALEARVGKPFDQRKDELGTLARDFDTMAEQIQTLITDKEVLLRDVSHELRSPLARIRVALALAERKAGDAAQEDLDRIDQETERLDQLVGQILTLARLRSSRLEQHVDIDLNELVSEVVGDARFEQADAGIEFKPGEVPAVRGNPGELASAVENVLRNALLHSGPRASVEISVEPAGADVTITVVDSGPGVPEKDLKRLFEPFYRVDPSRDHKQSGYGLGLAIAARIIERHGGRVEARNRPGGGLAVNFRLPAGRRSEAGTA
jgi:two-component system sensor histidine kinase CpxA